MADSFPERLYQPKHLTAVGVIKCFNTCQYKQIQICLIFISFINNKFEHLFAYHWTILLIYFFWNYLYIFLDHFSIAAFAFFILILKLLLY